MISKLHRAQRAFLVLDGDRAGFQGTMMLAAALWPKAKVVRLPLGADPSAFYCLRSKGEFEALVGAAMDPGNYAIEHVAVTTPREQLSEALKPFFEFLATVRPLAQEAYLEKMTARFKLGVEWKKRARQELDILSQGVTRCPACGTMWAMRRIS
jgi:DNA primase